MAMLVNGSLTNIEVIYGLTEQEICDLMKVDEYLLRQLLRADAKIAKEIMYLETSVLPLSYVVMSRRLNYLKQIC